MQAPAVSLLFVCWCRLFGDGSNLGWVDTQSFVRCYMSYERHFFLPKVKLVSVELNALLFAVV